MPGLDFIKKAGFLFALILLCESCFIPPAHDTFYDNSIIAEVHLQINTQDLEKLYSDPFSLEYVPATFIYNGKTIQDVAVRFKGNLQIAFNLWNDTRKYSFKVDFNYYRANQTFMGFKKTNLHNAVNDPSFLREHTAYRLFQDAGIVIPRVAYIRVFLNGEYQGLYNHVEQVDKTFLKNRFGNSNGNLYKPIMFYLQYLGDKVENYPLDLIGLDANTKNPDYSNLLHFIKILNNPQSPDFRERIESIFDVDNFLKFLAVNTFILNLDSYDPLGHNYYLYDNPHSGKFHFIPWDMSEAFGNFACKNDIGMYQFSIHRPLCDPPMDGVPDRPLILNILGVPEFKERYLAYMREYVKDGILNPNRLNQRLEETQQFIAEAVFQDFLKFYSYEDFLKNLYENVPNRARETAAPIEIYGLVSLVLARTENVLKQLEKQE